LRVLPPFRILKKIEWIEGVAPAMTGTAMGGMLARFGGVVASVMAAGQAFAGTGQPTPWQMGLQGAASDKMVNITWFHDIVLTPLIVVISVFVAILLVLVAKKFNAKANPVPSKTTHHVGLEVAWTLVPALILVAIAPYSFKILKEQVVIPKADIVIKATGYAWYWKFTYGKDHGGFEFETRMLSDDERAKAVAAGKGTAADFPRLLAVDNEVVVPVNKVVAVQVTAGDVLHAFAVNSFGIKIDAVPGRLNETWFKATREGIYYGQCQELCGKDHAFMPFAVRVVSQERYNAWLADAKKKYAAVGEPTVQTADAALQR
jgi:cytochrome c oxidase subunit II